jgi:GNAT superfamily N-acetyltransferase
MIRLIEHGSAEYEETVALRENLLRRPLGLTLTPDELADEASDYHVACYEEGRLVGCLVLTPRPGRELKMRQVAVAEAMQGKGIGRAMVEFSERFARERGFFRITMNARETAVSFYEKLDYQRSGARFEQKTIPHWRMQKKL